MLKQILLLCFIFLISFALTYLVLAVIISRLTSYLWPSEEKLKRPWWLRGVHVLCAFWMSCWCVVLLLHNKILNNLFLSFFIITFTWMCILCISFVLKEIYDSHISVPKHFIKLPIGFTQIILWSVCTVIILLIWQVNIIPIVAGFGMTGLILGLGGKNFLNNIISGLIVLAEKRVVVGDWIRSGEGYGQRAIEGVVESIGLRSTRIRQLDYTPVFISNSRLIDLDVSNYTKAFVRAIEHKVSIPISFSNGGFLHKLLDIKNNIEGKLSTNLDLWNTGQYSVSARIVSIEQDIVILCIRCFTRKIHPIEYQKVEEHVLLVIYEIIESSLV